MFPAFAYTGIVRRGIQKTIWQRRRGNIVTKPGILLLSMALVSCMLLTACADSFASPARASEGSNQQEPSSPERGSAAVEATEKRELLVRFAVEKNPVLEGWGNKIVIISDGEGKQYHGRQNERSGSGPEPGSRRL